MSAGQSVTFLSIMLLSELTHIFTELKNILSELKMFDGEQFVLQY